MHSNTTSKLWRLLMLSIVLRLDPVGHNGKLCFIQWVVMKRHGFELVLLTAEIRCKTIVG
jgi:hypothetical protein